MKRQTYNALLCIFPGRPRGRRHVGAGISPGSGCIADTRDCTDKAKGSRRLWHTFLSTNLHPLLHLQAVCLPPHTCAHQLQLLNSWRYTQTRASYLSYTRFTLGDIQSIESHASFSSALLRAKPIILQHFDGCLSLASWPVNVLLALPNSTSAKLICGLLAQSAFKGNIPPAKIFVVSTD